MPSTHRISRVRTTSAAGLVVLAVIVLALSAPTAPAGASPTRAARSAAARALPRVRLVFDDEFTGRVAASKWEVKDGSFGSANHQMECNKPANVTTSGGSLLITARRQKVACPPTLAAYSFTSGAMVAKNLLPLYGRFEMRAKIPHGQALWPAFWLQHGETAKTAEVDIMEAFQSQNPGTARTVVHSDGRTNLSMKNTFLEAETSTPAWHTYSVDILPDLTGVRFVFSIDGKVVHNFVDTQHHWTNGVDPKATWQMTLNLAVGGDWVGDPDGPLGLLANGTCAEVWAQLPPCPTTGIVRAKFPATFAVDWVRVWTIS